jgi:hypothetical protein
MKQSIPKVAGRGARFGPGVRIVNVLTDFTLKNRVVSSGFSSWGMGFAYPKLYHTHSACEFPPPVTIILVILYRYAHSPKTSNHPVSHLGRASGLQAV